MGCGGTGVASKVDAEGSGKGTGAVAPAGAGAACPFAAGAGVCSTGFVSGSNASGCGSRIDAGFELIEPFLLIDPFLGELDKDAIGSSVSDLTDPGVPGREASRKKDELRRYAEVIRVLTFFIAIQFSTFPATQAHEILYMVSVGHEMCCPRPQLGLRRDRWRDKREKQMLIMRRARTGRRQRCI